MNSLLMKNSEIDLAIAYDHEDCVKELGNLISYELFVNEKLRNRLGYYVRI